MATGHLIVADVWYKVSAFKHNRIVSLVAHTGILCETEDGQKIELNWNPNKTFETIAEPIGADDRYSWRQHLTHLQGGSILFFLTEWFKQNLYAVIKCDCRSFAATFCQALKQCIPNSAVQRRCTSAIDYFSNLKFKDVSIFFIIAVVVIVGIAWMSCSQKPKTD